MNWWQLLGGLGALVTATVAVGAVVSFAPAALGDTSSLVAVALVAVFVAALVAVGVRASLRLSTAYW